jgi:hypothetical protein
VPDEAVSRAIADTVEAAADALLTAAAAFIVAEGHKVTTTRSQMVAVQAINHIIAVTEAEGARPR